MDRRPASKLKRHVRLPPAALKAVGAPERTDPDHRGQPLRSRLRTNAPTRRRGWICPNELDSLSNLPYGRSQAEAIGLSRYGTRGYTTLGAAIVHGPGGEAKTPAGLDEKPVQVVIVDDYPLARQALPALLAANGIVVSGTASSVHD